MQADDFQNRFCFVGCAQETVAHERELAYTSLYAIFLNLLKCHWLFLN